MSLSGPRGAAAGSAETRRRGPRPPGALSVRRRASHGARPRGGRGAVRRTPGCGRSGGLCRRDRCQAPAGTLRFPRLSFLPPPPLPSATARSAARRGRGRLRGGRGPPFWVARAGPRCGLWRGAGRGGECGASAEGARSGARLFRHRAAAARPALPPAAAWEAGARRRLPGKAGGRRSSLRVLGCVEV